MLWPEFLDFLREVGEPPTPGHELAGAIEGTPVAPGNVKWKVRTKLEQIKETTLTHLEPMFFDEELKQLAIQAYLEKQENPVSELIHLDNLEEESRQQINDADDLHELQRYMEKLSQEYLSVQRKHNEARLATQGRSSQIRVGREMRRKLVPSLSRQLKMLHESALEQNVGRHHAVIKPLLEKLGVDYGILAHITVTCVIDGIGRGVAMSSPLVKIFRDIGERIDHEAYLTTMKAEDPEGWSRVDRWVLKNEVKGYLIADVKLGIPRFVVSDSTAGVFMNSRRIPSADVMCQAHHLLSDRAANFCFVLSKIIFEVFNERGNFVSGFYTC